MTSIFKQFQTSEDLESSGVWLDFGSFEIKIARAGGANKRFATASNLYFEPLQAQIAVGALTDEKAAPALAQVYADSVVLAWRTRTDTGYVDTIEGPDGEPLQFTRDNVIRVLLELPSFFTVLRGHAVNFANFRRALRDEAAKN